MDNLRHIKIDNEAKIIMMAVYDFTGVPIPFDSIDLENKHINWNKVHEYSQNSDCVSLLYRFLTGKVEESKIEKIKEEYYDNIESKKIAKQELKNILLLLEENHIENLYIKGFILGKFLYDDINIRDFGDIDLLFYNDKLIKARDLLLNSMSYKQVNRGVARDEHIDIVGVFHEFWLEKKVDGMIVSVEIKNSTSAVTQEFISDYMDNPEIVTFDGICVRTMNLYYTTLHLLLNTYENFESKNGVFFGTTIRDILDCYLLIDKYFDKINWYKINELANKYKVAYKIYRVLNYIKLVFSTEKIKYLENIFFNNYENFLSWNWNQNVIERIFMSSDERIKEYYKLVYKRAMEKAQLDSEKRKIRKNSKDVLKDFSKYNLLEIKECDYKFEYLFTYDKEIMYINILLGEKMYHRKDILVQFLFVIYDREESVWLSNENGYKYCTKEDIGDSELEFQMNCEEIYLEKNYLIRIPYDIGSKPETINNKLFLGFNIQLYSKFDNGLTIQRMTAFGNKYAMEETFDEMEGCWINKTE